MAIAWAEDAFKREYRDPASTVVQDVLNRIDLLQQQSDWEQFSDAWQVEFSQLEQEARALNHRLAANLDYLGNPAGYTGLLSLEANFLAYTLEVDRAVRQFFLVWWIQNAANDIQSKVDGMLALRMNLGNEIEDSKVRFAAAADALPALEIEATAISNQVVVVQGRLAQIEQELMARAEHNVADRNRVPSWKKGLAVASTLMKVVPVYQPALGTIGTGLDLIANFDPQRPLDSAGAAIDLVGQFKEENFKKSAADFQETLASVNFDAYLRGVVVTNKGTDGKVTFTTNGITTWMKNVAAIVKPIGKGLSEIQNTLKDQTAPQSEVEAEFRRLRAIDPAFNSLSDDLSQLMTRKEVFGRQVNEALQTLASLQNSIQKDFLAIDGLNRDTSAGNAVLDERALRYLKQIERQAKEHLEKYYYQVRKSFEYRQLKPFTGELDLTRMYSKELLSWIATAQQKVVQDAQQP